MLVAIVVRLSGMPNLSWFGALVLSQAGPLGQPLMRDHSSYAVDPPKYAL